MPTTRSLFSVTVAVILVTGCSKTGSDDDGRPPAVRDTIASTNSPTDTANAPTAVAPLSTWTVTPRGIGPIRVGMSLAEVEAVVPISVTKPAASPECDYISPRDGPAGVNFMIRNGRIARADITDSIFATAKGARMGDSEERIKQLYPGQVEVVPHKYVDGHYLIVTPNVPSDSAHRFVFETDGKRVTRFRSGKMPEVTWVEGCS
ncbi:MAG: hypothetical protein H7Z74_07540 [Anaerolineae bacterium]|nr:hypothetical protein [Gemmatimonadaceae bacterium]